MKKLIFLIGLSIALTGCGAPPSYYFIDGHYYRVNDEQNVELPGVTIVGSDDIVVYEELSRHGSWVPTQRDIRRRISPDTRVSAGVAESEQVRRACKIATTCGAASAREAGQGGGDF